MEEKVDGYRSGVWQQQEGCQKVSGVVLLVASPAVFFHFDHVFSPCARFLSVPITWDVTRTHPNPEQGSEIEKKTEDKSSPGMNPVRYLCCLFWTGTGFGELLNSSVFLLDHGVISHHNSCICLDSYVRYKVLALQPLRREFRGAKCRAEAAERSNARQSMEKMIDSSSNSGF